MAIYMDTETKNKALKILYSMKKLNIELKAMYTLKELESIAKSADYEVTDVMYCLRYAIPHYN